MFRSAHRIKTVGSLLLWVVTKWIVTKRETGLLSTHGVMGRLLFMDLSALGIWLTLPFASGIIDDLIVKAKVFGVYPGQFC
jgi:hypothetical protein